jgi:hypothetical protein
MLPSKRKSIRFFGAVDARGLPPPPSEELPFLRAEFYVWSESGEPVGPVSVDQIARGILAGRVPLQAFVTRPGETEWRKVLETREIVRALELSSEVETIDVLDEEEELVEVFDDVDDLGEAIERATSIYDAKELGTEPYDGSEDGTGHFQAQASDALVEEYRSRESPAFISSVPEAELPLDTASAEDHGAGDPDADAGTGRYVASDESSAAALLDRVSADEGHEGPVATALATALSKAAEHGRWDVVLELARQLEARRPGPPAPSSLKPSS